MKLTIKEALQKGIIAHKEGRLKEADQYYTAILQAHPNHPDANHNLGILAVSVNKAEAAIPFFKTALETNPKIEKFWLNYINTLIKCNKLNKAKAMLEKAIKQGFKRDKLNALEVQIDSINGTEETTELIPSSKQIRNLFEYYQKGQFSEAEKLAISITKEFPQHKPAWKILGVVLRSTGQISESLIPLQKYVELEPKDVEAHNNLGITLSEIGRMEEAVASFTQAIALKPDYYEAYYNLGITLIKFGRLQEAEVNYRKAIALQPSIPEAHINLGNTLKELGRMEEAEASYNQAIALRPDYYEAHYNLGITLHELGKMKEAEASYHKAISLKPEIPEAHNNLGITLKELGRMEEAEASYNQAIALNPDYSNAYNNLGVVLKELGRLEEAEASHTKSIALNPDYAEAIFDLATVHGYMNNLEAEIVSLKNVLQIDSDNIGLRAGVNLAICNFLKGDFKESKKQVLAAKKIKEKTLPKFKNEKVYQEYLLKILKWHEDKYLGVHKRKNDKNLFVVGESHSLTSHHLRIQYSGFDFFCNSRLIVGCKQWYLGNALRNEYKNLFENIFFSIPKYSYVLLAIGEIDCRLNSGIIKHKNKFPKKKIKKIINNTIENYLNYVKKNNSSSQHKIIIQGVPCPNIDIKNHSQVDIKQLVNVTNIFNCELNIKSKERGFDFLDLHQLTNKDDGLSNSFWHIDDYHISPEGMQEAWRRHST